MGRFTAMISRNNARIYVLTYPVGEKTAWYVLDVDSVKQQRFRHHLTLPAPITLTDYGKILYSGWGEGPDKSLKAVLNKQYGLYE